jgi:hypothetical protein
VSGGEGTVCAADAECRDAVHADPLDLPEVGAAPPALTLIKQELPERLAVKVVEVVRLDIHQRQRSMTGSEMLD